MSNKSQLVKIFSDLAFYEEFIGREFPAKAYKNAVKIIRAFPVVDIVEAKQLDGIFGIGKGIKEKIDLFIQTGTFPKYEEYLQSDASKCMEIASIKGFGAKKAKRLFECGIHSLAELREAVKDLKVGQPLGNTGFNFTKAMKIGLDYEAHTDKTRMTVEQHDAVANPMIEAIRNYDGVLGLAAVGSRRRYDGSQDYTIGDIDIIISVQNRKMLPEFCKFLEGLLDEVTMSGETKISGIKNRRQVDFRMVIGNYGALLLHATGPMEFNVACRKIAMKNGWTLSEYGLHETATQKLLSNDEREILNLLGLGWVNPKDRNKYK